MIYYVNQLKSLRLKPFLPYNFDRVTLSVGGNA